MASSQEVQELITLGASLLTNRRFLAGVNAIWCYDYFLTLPDEINLVWSGKKSFAFWLFISNRYWPVWYVIWTYLAYWSPEFTKLCDKTSWFPMLYSAFVILFSQSAITLRIYAITGNNRLIACGLSFMSLAQFTFGTYLSVRFAMRGTLQSPEIPLEEYQICIFEPWRRMEITFTVLSLVYDCVAFLVIAFSARKRGHVYAPGVPSLLTNIIEGATAYFFVVFAGQLLFIFFELLAPAPIQTLPGSAIVIIIPLMATRLMTSLKKAAKGPRSAWGLIHPCETVETVRMESTRFPHRVIDGVEYGDDIALKHIPTEGRVGLSNGYA